MTVSSTTNKNIYVGNGALLVFAYTFKIFEDADLDVSIQDTSVSPQTEITLVLNQDYTVSDAGNPAGGNVTLIVGGASQLTAAPSATDNITIRRVLPLTQETDYVENDDFPAESHEEVADRGTMVDQQLQETLARALVIPANLTGISTELPTPEAGAPIGWNAAGDGLTNNPPQDNYSAVDATATPDFIGATGATGVIRVDATLNYADGGDYVTISVAPGAVDHDALLNFVANEHIDHSAVSITGGGILSGGGDITASRVITLNSSDVDHDSTTNFVANEHIDHTTVSISAGAGLTGGGDISANRSLAVDIPGQTAGTVASGDLVLIADIDDSNNLKKVTAQSIADLGGGSTSLTYDVTQATHGFSVGDWVYHNGTGYALADATAASTVDSTIGVVSAVADVNNFTVQFGGRITGLSGLTAGGVHYISETAGQITATAPTSPAIAKPVLVADSTTTGFIFNNTAEGGGGGTGVGIVDAFVNGDLTAGVLTVAHNIGNQYVQVQVYDNNDNLVMPDDVTLTDANNLDIDLSSYGTITATWHAVILDVGSTYNLAEQTSVGCRVYDSSNQSIPDSAQTAINFDGEEYDTDNMHDTVTNNTRITINKTGKYVIWAGVGWAANATGIRQVNITKNGTTVLATNQTHSPNGINNFNMTQSTIADLTAGDYVECIVFQNSGGALNVVGGGGGTAQAFAAHRLAPTVTNGPADIGARVYKSGAQSIPNNAVTELTYDLERWDTDSLHSTVTATGRFTAQRKGKYVISSDVTFASNTTGARAILMRHNASFVIQRQDAAATASSTAISLNMSTIYELDIGDTVHVEAFQTSGGALNVSLAEMSIQLIAES